ncbi:MAG: molybdenum ABC transporter permease subunit [Acidobacteria bacterium RIFCSPLOWO2_02_FULL_68_18]|nr:MAG: molybdenum ABC transporter permease subunit [Acidobacteria bacterium RIFCSPLOWO2_02_FULL_68_18]OFW50846.1 MAG: molybdenum ABC transporter permease subunit [Acidobacteria bacterium RIFCSPLOWO2_12_FULL_68_19]
MDWTAILLTVKLAALTTLLLAIVGLPLAYWLATTRRRWRAVVDAAVAVPLLLPPTVLGFYFLMSTGPNTAVGRLYGRLFDGTLPFSFAGILLASVVYNLPFAVRPFASGFAAVDHRLIEAARCLGASGPRTFLTVVLPLSWPAVLAGLVLAFAHTVGEFGVVLMVGGNIPGVTRTIALAIYDDVQALDYASANAASALLVVFAAAVLGVTYSLQRRPLPL